ncbi:MAG: hypothetical protein BJ554DRAFT_1958 [Olpidium bornovanus]|uniref:WW domain-containing protein n=1 Tax=Olpidium bornovanus TaxID=278681 RepID=A0A8H7ZR96_9FUNG|nr:MAG: hypothetical protein BJ554DRAFT_1958 [Olpidium bornovanus]
MAAERGPGGPLVNGASTEPRAAFSAATQLPPGAEAFGSRPVAREWIEITDPQTQLTFYADPVEWNRAVGRRGGAYQFRLVDLAPAAFTYHCRHSNIPCSFCREARFERPWRSLKRSYYSATVCEARRRKDPAGEWWELYDDNHKLPYYYNANSGQTEWLRPTTGSIIPLALIQSSALGKRVSVALRHSFDELKLPVRSSVSLHDGNSPQPDIHDISMEPNQHLRGRTLFKTAADGRHDSSRNPSSSDKAAGIPEGKPWRPPPALV